MYSRDNVEGIEVPFGICLKTIEANQEGIEIPFGICLKTIEANQGSSVSENIKSVCVCKKTCTDYLDVFFGGGGFWTISGQKWPF